MGKIKGKIFLNEDLCIGCGACIQSCPMGVILPKKDVPNEPHIAYPTFCVGCARCARSCPQRAIRVERYVEQK